MKKPPIYSLLLNAETKKKQDASFLPFFNRGVVFRCVRQERISIRGSVRPSVHWSIRPYVHPLHKCKNRVSRLFLATMRSYTESNDRQTCFESLLYYSCRFICLFVHLSLHICHMFNTRRDTARTHRCPVGLVC